MMFDQIMINTWIVCLGLCFVHFCLFCSDPDCECAQLIGVLEEEREVAKVDKSWGGAATASLSLIWQNSKVRLVAVEIDPCYNITTK